MSTDLKKAIGELMSIINRKARYYWTESGLSLKLVAEMDWEDGTKTHAPDQHVVECIAEWCLKNKCGKRTSYDTFKFRNRKQITMFLLRWAEVKDE